MPFKYKFSFSVISSLFFLPSLLAQEKNIEINGSVYNINNEPIPYVSVYPRKNYGVIADENGKYILKINNADSVVFSCIGFKRKILAVSDILSNNSIVYLDSLFVELPPFVFDFNKKTLEINKKVKVKKNSYVLTTNFWHGSVINSNDLLGRQILEIKFKIGFKGNPPLPLRLVIFSVDKNGFPISSLLQKDIIIYPNSNFGWHIVDLNDYQLVLEQNKVAIAFEVLNVSTSLKNFNENYSPLIGVSKSKIQSPLFLTKKLPSWVKLGEYSPHFVLKLR